MRTRTIPTATTRTGASTDSLVWFKGSEASLGYRGVITKPLTSHNDGGIDLKKIAPKARVY